MQSLPSTFTKLEKKFQVKFKYIFSDPKCPFVINECEIGDAINIKPNGRQGTFES